MALDDDATAGKASTKPKQRKHPPLKSLPVFEGVFSFAVIKCIAQAPSSNCQNFPFLPLRGHAVPLACARNYTRFDSSKICKHARRRKPLRGLRIICGSGLSIRDLESNRFHVQSEDGAWATEVEAPQEGLRAKAYYCSLHARVFFRFSVIFNWLNDEGLSAG